MSAGEYKRLMLIQYKVQVQWIIFKTNIFIQDCTGGFVVFFLACYSYITDITTKEERTKRLAYLDGMFPAGFFLGRLKVACVNLLMYFS